MEYSGEPGTGGGAAGGSGGAPASGFEIWPIVKESLQGSALSALLLGLALGILTRPESVYESFFDPPFRGLLSVLMLVMGMEAWARLGELRKVGQWYALYAVVAPLLHGFIGFGLGYDCPHHYRDSALAASCSYPSSLPPVLTFLGRPRYEPVFPSSQSLRLHRLVHSRWYTDCAGRMYSVLHWACSGNDGGWLIPDGPRSAGAPLARRPTQRSNGAARASRNRALLPFP
jgi:hypothetical protein